MSACGPGVLAIYFKHHQLGAVQARFLQVGIRQIRPLAGRPHLVQLPADQRLLDQLFAGCAQAVRGDRGRFGGVTFYASCRQIVIFWGYAKDFRTRYIGSKMRFATLKRPITTRSLSVAQSNFVAVAAFLGGSRDGISYTTIAFNCGARL